jgi:glucose-6-phosphate isomerase
MIHVSLEGLLQPVCEGGLDREEVGTARTALEEAHHSLMLRRNEDIGFYNLPGETGEIEACVTEAKRLRALATDLLVLGIGGSSLGGQALLGSHRPVGDMSTKVHFLDNIDPDTLQWTLGRLDPAQTAAVVITKSGGTVETMALFLTVRRWLKSSLGLGAAQSRMTFITDPNKGLLRSLAQSEGVRSFSIPANVGGRFSVLTAVGLLPAAFMGMDIAAVCAGARQMSERVQGNDLVNNPAAQFALGTLMSQRALGSNNLVLMPYADGLRILSQWFVQLWAESLGKRFDTQGQEVRTGQTPVPAVGATDQHAQLQLFVEGPKDKVVAMIHVKSFEHASPIPDELNGREEVTFLHGRDLRELLEAERRATRSALLTSGVGVIDIVVERLSPEVMGCLFVLFEAACALAGTAMKIDPFNQPGVEAGKRMAFGLLGRVGYEADAELVRARESMEQGLSD